MRSRDRPPIIAFAPNAWHEPWRNRQQLLSRLARRGWPVVYSTGAFTVWERGSGDWRAAPVWSGFGFSDGVAIDRPGKLWLRWPTWPAWDRFIVRRHARRLLRQAGAAADGAIVYAFHPAFLPYAEALDPRFVVYHAYDVFALDPGWTADDAALESALAERADLVIATTKGVMRHLPGAGRARREILLNAADSRAFAAGRTAPCPPDLAAIPHPRLSYIGVLSRKIDFGAVAETARRRPDWHWVMVGRVIDRGPAAVQDDPVVGAAYRECRQLANVHFLGEKPHADLPAYAAHCDVNTMCYRTDPGWWSVAYPLKLHELLAAGPPVVGAAIGDIPEFDGVIELAASAGEWPAAIERALRPEAPGRAARRLEIALANTWDHRVDELEGWLTELVEGRRAAA